MATGASIVGSGNTVSSLLNLEPQVNVDVKALNVVKQESTGVTGGIVIPGNAGGVGRPVVAAGRAANYIGGSQLRKSQRKELMIVPPTSHISTSQQNPQDPALSATETQFQV